MNEINEEGAGRGDPLAVGAVFDALILVARDELGVPVLRLASLPAVCSLSSEAFIPFARTP